MGSVYTAIHPVLGKRVAVKVLAASFAGDAEAVARFREEARIVSRIAHRNLVDIYSFGTLKDGRPYFVMEWLAGQTLEARLRRGPLPLSDAVNIVDQMACALEAVHAHGVVHRDIKPENVVLVPIGSGMLAKLVDFGVAKLVRARPTTSGVLGTPEYFSPEQARGGDVDARSDIYSLGLVLFEAVLGRRAFDGLQPLELARQHLQDRPPRVRNLWPAAPARLDALIDRMLRKDPAERPSLVEVRTALRGLAAVRPTVRRSRPRWRWLVVGGVLAASVAAICSTPRRNVAPEVAEAAPVEAGYCPAPPEPPHKHTLPSLSDDLIDPFSGVLVKVKRR
jgi:serine/threonine-protein kinase